jgi:hypothetical protein
MGTKKPLNVAVQVTATLLNSDTNVQCTCFRSAIPNFDSILLKKQKYLKHINVFDYLHIIFLFEVKKNIKQPFAF